MRLYQHSSDSATTGPAVVELVSVPAGDRCPCCGGVGRVYCRAQNPGVRGTVMDCPKCIERVRVEAARFARLMRGIK